MKEFGSNIKYNYIPRTQCSWRVYCFHVVCPSVTFCFLNILKSYCWNFIKPCKHIHIYKIKTFNIKVRAKGHIFVELFPFVILNGFSYTRVYAYSMLVHTWADQLIPQLLMEQFDNLPSQCRHLVHMHEGV